MNSRPVPPETLARIERAYLLFLLQAILDNFAAEMKGVSVRLPFWLVAQIQAAVRTLSMVHPTDAAIGK